MIKRINDFEDYEIPSWFDAVNEFEEPEDEPEEDYYPEERYDYQDFI